MGACVLGDTNRILEVHKKKRRTFIWPVEAGRVVFDRRVSRSAES